MTIISQCKKHLKLSGILVLDSHKSTFDIVLTGLYLKRVFPGSYLYMPIAGYLIYIPVVKTLVNRFASINKVTLFPVFRSEELVPINVWMRLLVKFYPKELIPEIKRGMNQYFIDECRTKLTDPYSIVLVAPYGSPILFGNKVKYGVRVMIKTSTKSLLTVTRWSWKKLSFITSIREYNENLLAKYQSMVNKMTI